MFTLTHLSSSSELCYFFRDRVLKICLKLSWKRLTAADNIKKKKRLRAIDLHNIKQRRSFCKMPLFTHPEQCNTAPPCYFRPRRHVQHSYITVWSEVFTLATCLRWQQQSFTIPVMRRRISSSNEHYIVSITCKHFCCFSSFVRLAAKRC